MHFSLPLSKLSHISVVPIPDISPSLPSQRPGEWLFLIPYPVKDRERRGRSYLAGQGRARVREGTLRATMGTIGPCTGDFMVEEEGKGPQND